MRKITLTFGLIAGAFLSVFLTVGLALMNSGALGFENGELRGYISMFLAMSMVFFGIKSYRDNVLDGIISFGKGFQVGIMIALVASVMYSATWEAIAQFQPDEMAMFMDGYTEHVIEKIKISGDTQVEIDQQLAEIEKSIGWMKKPLIRLGISFFAEIFPVGLLVTLISAAVLRRKEMLPAQPAAVG